MHTAKPLAPELNGFEVGMAIETLKRHKSPCIDEISEKMIKAGSRTIHSVVHKLINFLWNNEECKVSIIVPIYNTGGIADCSNHRSKSLYQICTKFYPASCCQC